MQENRVQSLGWEDSLEKAMATHSSIIAWKIPWTEEPGRLQSMGSQKIQTQLSNKQFHFHSCFSLHFASGKESACQCRRHKRPEKIHWRRAWLPTPLFSPGKIPCTEEPEGLQSLVSQRVRHNWVTNTVPFPDDIRCWASFHMLTCHLYIYSGEVSVRSLTFFLFGSVVFLLLIFKSSFNIMANSSLWDIFCKDFFPVEVCLLISSSCLSQSKS